MDLVLIELFEIIREPMRGFGGIQRCPPPSGTGFGLILRQEDGQISDQTKELPRSTRVAVGKCPPVLSEAHQVECPGGRVLWTLARIYSSPQALAIQGLICYDERDERC